MGSTHLHELELRVWWRRWCLQGEAQQVASHAHVALQSSQGEHQCHNTAPVKMHGCGACNDNEPRAAQKAQANGGLNPKGQMPIVCTFVKLETDAFWCKSSPKLCRISASVNRDRGLRRKMSGRTDTMLLRMSGTSVHEQSRHDRQIRFFTSPM